MALNSCSEVSHAGKIEDLNNSLLLSNSPIWWMSDLLGEQLLKLKEDSNEDVLN